MIPLRLASATFEPVMVPVTDPVMVPDFDPVMVPVFDPVIVPAMAAEPRMMVKVKAAEIC